MKLNFNEMFMTERYGGVPDSLRKFPDNRYPKALLIVVGGDGVISDREWVALEQTARAAGHSPESIAELKDFDWRHANLEEIVAQVPDPHVGRRLLYDAILVSHADGYSPEERAMARRMADRLGIDHSTLLSLEAMVDAEIALRQIRRCWFTSA